MAIEHKDFDGCAITGRHLGLVGDAWVTHAWDDWYYCHVKGRFPNGSNKEIDGIYCRARADEIAPYLIKGDNGGPVKSKFAQ